MNFMNDTYKNMINEIARRQYQLDTEDRGNTWITKVEGEIWGMVKATAHIFGIPSDDVYDAVNEIVDTMYN